MRIGEDHMAIGKTQVKVQINRIKIYMEFLLCENGQGVSTIDEVSLSKALKMKT